MMCYFCQLGRPDREGIHVVHVQCGGGRYYARHVCRECWPHALVHSVPENLLGEPVYVLRRAVARRLRREIGLRAV